MSTHPQPTHGGGHYGRLLAMLAISFLAMYALMYAMDDRWDNVYANINQVYMAGLMAAPMPIVELLLMSSMYPNRRRNLLIIIGALLFMAACWFGIRQQAAVSDRQFIRSMIPHHAGAILMCRRNALENPALQRLCGDIVESQESEIAQMKALLEEDR